MLDKIHAHRLTELVRILESDEPLMVGTFNFRHVYIDAESVNFWGSIPGPLTPFLPPCGSVGCAIGEARLRWPGLFHRSIDAYLEDACEVFGLTQAEANRLFTPVMGSDTPKDYCGAVLPPDATRYQVAAEIRKFLEEQKLEQP